MPVSNELAPQLFSPSEEPVAPSLFDPQMIPLPPKAARQRAAKASFGMQDQGELFSPEVLESAMSRGDERRHREHASNLIAQQKQREQQGLVHDYIKTHPGNIQEGEIELLKTIGGELPAPDPDTIFEAQYARQVLNTTLASLGEDSSFDNAVGVSPDETFDTVEAFGDVILRNEILRKHHEDLQAKIANTGWIRSIEDATEQFVPFMSWKRLSDASGEGDGFWLDDQMRNARDRILSLPPEEMNRELTKTVEELSQSNIYDAQDFLDRMIRYTSSDAFLDLAGNVLDVADLPIAGAGSIIAGGARLGLKVGRRQVSKQIAKAGERKAVQEAQQTAEATLQTPSSTITVKTDSPEATAKAIGSMQEALTYDSSTPVYDLNAPVRIREDGSPVFARYNKDTKTIFINREGVRNQFADKPWTKPKVKGVHALPTDSFKTPDEWVDFVIRHEQTHVTNPKLEGESKADYENRINDLALKSFKTERPLKDTLKNVTKELAKPEVQVENIIAATGDTVGAAKTKIVKANTAKGKLLEGDVYLQGRKLVSEAVSLINPESIVKGPMRLAEPLARDIAREMDNQASKIADILKINNLNRLTPEAEAIAVDVAFKSLKERVNKSIQDTVLDIVNPIDKALIKDADPIRGQVVRSASTGRPTGTTSVELHLGTPDKELFTSETQAALVGTDLYRLPKFTIAKEGEGYYIVVSKDIDETSGDIRDALITTDNASPQTMANAIVGFLRSPEDTLSNLHRENRHAYTHAVQEVASLLTETADNIGVLSKKQKQGLNRVLEANRNHPRQIVRADGSVEEKRGKWNRTIGEFEQEYLNINKRFPTARETKAYFSAIQLNDIDYILRNLGLYRDKSRQGIENFTFRYNSLDEEGNPIFANTPKFEGKEIDALPEDVAEDAGIVVYDHDTGKSRYMRKNNRSQEEKDYIKDKLDNGNYKIIQIANPTSRPFGGQKEVSQAVGTDDVINFILVRDYQVTPLDWKQIDYQPGGHVIYNTQFFVKQAKVRDSSYGTKIYEGDVSILGFTTEAQAKKFAPRVDKARQLVVEDNFPAFKNYVEKNLPHNPKELWDMFQEKELADGTIKPALLDKNEPIVYVKSRQGVNDKTEGALRRRHPNLEDTIDSSFNLYRNIDKKFAGEREVALQTVAESGTEQNPLYNLSDARHIDPLSTLNMSTANIVRARFMADYNHYAIESFMREFGDTLRGDVRDHMRNPVAALYGGDFKDPSAVDGDRVAHAKNIRRAIINLIGTPDDTQTTVNQIKNKLLDSVYNSGLSPEKAGKAVDMLDDNLAAVNDPFKYTRAVAFHTKLGLFNPVQFFLQAQGLGTIASIAPTHAVPSMYAGFLMRRLAGTENRKIIEDFASKASKLGWSKEEFLESFDEFTKTGLRHVEGDNAILDDIAAPQLFGGGKINRAGAKFLDAGTIFFKEPERMIRHTSWNVAYREWKKANPNKKINSRDRNIILRRANDLQINMTRASNASWQKGVFSIPTQFFGYQARLTELFMGKRLSKAEKARMFVVNSMLYGMPVAAGGAVGVWPVYDAVKTYAMENHIETDDNALEVLVDGMVSTGIEAMFGTDANFGQRYGASGLTLFRDIFQDAKFLEILVGASGSIIGGMAETTLPVWNAVSGVFEPEDEKYPFIMQDFIDALRPISSANNALKTIYAMNTGKYISAKEVYLDEVGSIEALFMGITGLTPQEIGDSYLRIARMKDLQEAKKQASDQAIKYLRRGMDFSGKGDSEEAKKNYRAAKYMLIAGGIRPDEHSKILSNALKDNLSFVDTIAAEWEKAFPKEEGK